MFFTAIYIKVKTEIFLELFLAIPLTSEIAKFAGDLSIKYKLDLADSVIAATSIENDLTLVTRNIRHYIKYCCFNHSLYPVLLVKFKHPTSEIFIRAFYKPKFFIKTFVTFCSHQANESILGCLFFYIIHRHCHHL